MDYELVTWTVYALLRRGSSIRIAPESPRTVDTLCIGGFFLDLGKFFRTFAIRNKGFVCVVLFNPSVEPVIIHKSDAPESLCKQSLLF